MDAEENAWELDEEDGTVSAGETARIIRCGRPMFLNNTGRETIKLVNPTGDTVDERTYEGASSGEVVEFS